MRAKILVAVTVAMVALFTIILGSQVHAWTQFKSGNSGTVPGGQTINSSLWVGAKNIDIAGTVNGDVFCGGQTVNISGTVKGDVVCVGQTISISGNVEGSVRLAGQTVNITGNIGHGATVAGQTANFDSKSTVGEDASIAARDMNLDGSIGRDLAAAGASLNLSGHVGRDISGTVDQVVLTSSATVGGGISYTSKNTITVNSGASVAGTVTQHPPKERPNRIGSMFIFTGVMAFFAALVLLIGALVITALLPQLVHQVSGQAMKRPWMVLLTGFVASLAVPIFILLLMITAIGLPLGILLLVTWALIAMSSGLFSAYYVGRRIWSSQNNPLLRVLLGGVILMILFLIPIIGFLAAIAAYWMGAGMVLLELKARTPKPHYQLK